MYRSKTMEKTCNPEWKEEFSFYVFDKEQSISIDLFDDDFGKSDDFLGRVELSVANLLERCGSGPVWIPLVPQDDDKDMDDDGKNTEPVQGEVQISAQWMPISLDVAKARAIKASAHKPQALMFLGFYSVKVPPAAVGTAYTITVTCNGTEEKLNKASTAPAACCDGDISHSAETQEKIQRLISAKVSDEDIAHVLSIPVEELKEKEPLAAKYTEEVVVEEPFLWFIDVPKETTVDITVSEGKTELGKVTVQVSRTVEVNMCSLRETVKDESGKIKCDIFTQVRVITQA